MAQANSGGRASLLRDHQDSHASAAVDEEGVGLLSADSQYHHGDDDHNSLPTFTPATTATPTTAHDDPNNPQPPITTPTIMPTMTPTDANLPHSDSHHSNTNPPKRSSFHLIPPSALAGSRSNSPSSPRPPRTPNRVRFDLNPTFVDPNPDPPPPRRHPRPARSSQGRRSNLWELVNRHDSDDVDSDSDSDAHLLSSPVPSPDPSSYATAARELHRPRSTLGAAFFNMANSIIGAGIIGQPYALRQAGLVAGLALLLGLAGVVDWTLRLMVVNSKLSGGATFQATLERCFGVAGLVAVSLAQGVFAFGGMVAFAVIVGDTVPRVVSDLWPGVRDVPGLAWALGSRKGAIVVFVMGLSWPLTWYQDIAKLAKASALALVSMAVIILTVVVQCIVTPPEDRGRIDSSLLWINFDGIFQAIGVISFAFVCHHNSFLIYTSLEKPTLDRYARVTHYSTAISTLACLTMGLAGFLAFGDRTQGNVLNNFSPSSSSSPTFNPMVTLARLCFGLNMLTTLPLEAFVCRDVLTHCFWPAAPFSRARHVALATLLVAAATGLALTTCNLGAVFELVGATSAATMAYILPPLCYLRLRGRWPSARGAPRQQWSTYGAVAVVAFGCAVMVISVVQAVGKIMNGSENDDAASKCSA